MSAPKKIVLASANPIKVQACRRGFERMFPDETFEVESLPVPSGVADQPATDEETLLGARNRAEEAARRRPEADYWVGVEGGIEDDGHEMWAFAWVAVLAPGRSEPSRARSAAFPLPPEVARLVRQGVELGEADDRVFGRSNSKQKDGAVGILTHGVIDRAALYEPAVVLALIPLLNPGLYP